MFFLIIGILLILCIPVYRLCKEEGKRYDALSDDEKLEEFDARQW